MKLAHTIMFGLLVLALPVACTAATQADIPRFAERLVPDELVELAVFNGGFEQNGGWASFDGKAVRRVAGGHSGRFCGRVAAGVKTMQLFDVAPGDELELSVWIKVAKDCVVDVKSAYMDAEGRWIRGAYSPRWARGDQYEWQHVKATMLIENPAARKIDIEFTGRGWIDDLRVWKVRRGRTGDRQLVAGAVIRDLPAERYVRLESPEIAAWIDRRTGLIAQMVSLGPRPTLIQPAGVNSMQLFLQRQTTRRQDQPVMGFFNVAESVEVKGANEVVCGLRSDSPAIADLAKAQVTYTIVDGAVQADVAVGWLRKDSNRWRLGLRGVFVPSNWQSQLFPTSPIRTMAPHRRFAASMFTDAQGGEALLSHVIMPYAILEAREKYMLWGSTDLGHYLALNPNEMPFRAPAMYGAYLAPKAGDTSRISCTWKLFNKRDKGGVGLTQVVRWYLRHIRSSHPLTKDIVRFRENRRFFTPGTMAWYHPQGVGAWPDEYTGYRDDLLSREATNLWYCWYTNWNEEYLTEGEWYTYDCRRMSADYIHDEISRLKGHGFNVYLYFRQFLVPQGCHDDRPPYKRWLVLDSSGKPKKYLDYTVPKPELIGHEKITFGFLDFAQADCRQWYVEMVKRAIDRYQPSGVAWDMGWTSDLPADWSAGILWVQAQIYEYLKDRYPQMRVVANSGGIGPPHLLFADAAMIEGTWWWSWKKDPSYRITRAYDNAIFSFQIEEEYQKVVGPVTDASAYKYLVVECKGENLDTSDGGPFVMAPLGKHGFRSDGTWQIINVPVKEMKHQRFRVPFIATKTLPQGGGELRVRRLLLSNRPIRKRRDLESAMSDPTVLDCGWALESADSWVRMADKWLPRNPSRGRVVDTGDGLAFVLDQGDGGAYWACYEGVRDLMVEAQMRALAAGASCSQAILPSYKELNRLCAKLAGMLPINEQRGFRCDSKKIVGSLLHGPGGSWVGVFLYDAAKGGPVTIDILRDVLPGRSRPCDKDDFKVMVIGKDGRPMPDSDVAVIDVSANTIRIAGSFVGGELIWIER